MSFLVAATSYEEPFYKHLIELSGSLDDPNAKNLFVLPSDWIANQCPFASCETGELRGIINP